MISVRFLVINVGYLEEISKDYFHSTFRSVYLSKKNPKTRGISQKPRSSQKPLLHWPCKTQLLLFLATSTVFLVLRKLLSFCNRIGVGIR